MLKKVVCKPGVNRENTRYFTEGGWYECDKIRFRQGTPQTLGGWNPVDYIGLVAQNFLGICRSLLAWTNLIGSSYLGVGTNLKFYIRNNNVSSSLPLVYNDITPLRNTVTITTNAVFSATTGSNKILVTIATHGALDGDFVTFSNAGTLGGVITASVLNQNYQISFLTLNTFYIYTSVAANSSDTGSGGVSVIASFEISISSGTSYSPLLSGWGVGVWGGTTSGGGWGYSDLPTGIRLWQQGNLGEDLVFGYRGGSLYYFTASSSGTYSFNRGVLLQTKYPSGTSIPTIQNYVLVSDVYNIVIAFGCDDLNSSNSGVTGNGVQNPMLIRWSDQGTAAVWYPTTSNLAGGVSLSRGSKIVTAKQTRQEILVWTNAALYSMQFVGAPYAWNVQLLSSNTSIVSPSAMASAADITYWMGYNKFYKYDGRVQTLRCDLQEFVFNNIDLTQLDQVSCGTVERFHEIWWYYPSNNKSTNPNNNVDSYVVYNYIEDIWYYGSLSRSSWLDSSIFPYPIGATYSGMVSNATSINPLPTTTANTLVFHENGVDNNETGTAQAIYAFITSSEFDIDDGHNFCFIRRALPDLTFRGSSTSSPSVIITLYPLNNSGSGYVVMPDGNIGEGANVTQILPAGTTEAIVEQYTGQIYIRVRGRQLAFKIASNNLNNGQLGIAWQLGAIRIDIQQDGQRA